MPNNQNLLLREKLKQIGFKLTDLSEMLNISRPTLYSIIEQYEVGQRDKIDSKLLAFFKYIDEDETANRLDATRFVFEKITSSNIITSNQLQEKISNLLKKENHEKVKFIELLVKTDFFDPIMGYMTECYELIDKHNKSTEDKGLDPDTNKKLAPLVAVYTKLGFKIKIKGRTNEKNKNQ